jgi:hypothetical protein
MKTLDMGVEEYYIQVTGALLNGRTNSNLIRITFHHLIKELPDGRRALELS